MTKSWKQDWDEEWPDQFPGTKSREAGCVAPESRELQQRPNLQNVVEKKEGEDETRLIRLRSISSQTVTEEGRRAQEVQVRVELGNHRRWR